MKNDLICPHYISDGSCMADKCYYQSDIGDCTNPILSKAKIPPIGTTVYIPDTDSGKLTDIDIYNVTAHKITAYGTFIEVTGEYGTRKVRPKTVFITIKDAIKASERKLNG